MKFYSTILGEEVKIHEFMGKKLGFFPMEGESSVGGDLVPPGPGVKVSAEGTRVFLYSTPAYSQASSRASSIRLPAALTAMAA